MPTAVTSLRTGAVSVTFHIPYEQAEIAWRLHHLHGKSVTLDITPEEE